MVDASALAKMQAAPFFQAFAEYLPSVCSESPRATFLEVVAATD